jgi:hypothetical protein
MCFVLQSRKFYGFSLFSLVEKHLSEELLEHLHPGQLDRQGEGRHAPEQESGQWPININSDRTRAPQVAQ